MHRDGPQEQIKRSACRFFPRLFVSRRFGLERGFILGPVQIEAVPNMVPVGGLTCQFGIRRAERTLASVNSGFSSRSGS